MRDDELTQDIDKWSEKKLETWFCDSIARYEMMDIDRKTAITHTVATLMRTLVNVLATVDDATPEEVGQKFVEFIKIARCRG
jgi:hypothetical protein